MEFRLLQCHLLAVEALHRSWPWYVGGVLIGLMVPVLLIAGNKLLGVSSALRHVCAACFPGNITLFRYDWKKQLWNLFFAAGIMIGGFIGGNLLRDPSTEPISQHTIQRLQQNGIRFNAGYLPEQIFNWHFLFTLPGFIILVVGGFLVGFGTRYAGGCTSGHGITGLSTRQLPSLFAVASFFAGGIISSGFLLPLVLKLIK